MFTPLDTPVTPGSQLSPDTDVPVCFVQVFFRPGFVITVIFLLRFSCPDIAIIETLQSHFIPFIIKFLAKIALVAFSPDRLTDGLGAVVSVFINRHIPFVTVSWLDQARARPARHPKPFSQPMRQFAWTSVRRPLTYISSSRKVGGTASVSDSGSIFPVNTKMIPLASMTGKVSIRNLPIMLLFRLAIISQSTPFCRLKANP